MDKVLSPPVGKYGSRPYYALREHTLKHPNLPAYLRRQLQILVVFLGELTWINVDAHDLTPA